MRIIAVDDKPVPRRALVHAIQQAAPDAHVSACSSADEVLALPDLTGYDVVFLDIDLPGKGGIQLARELKAIHPRINIVFATGYGEYMADAFALHSSGYLMKPITADKVRRELADLRHPLDSPATDQLTVRCFGNFEAFSRGKSIDFERTKTKELFAYLVDQRGAVVGMRTVEAALWEDARSKTVSSSYLRTLVSDLKHTLESYGHDNVIVRRYGEIGIDCSLISCDYYDLLAGDPSALASWRGEYMSQYSWAEPTKAAIIKFLSDSDSL